MKMKQTKCRMSGKILTGVSTGINKNHRMWNKNEADKMQNVLKNSEGNFKGN